LSLARNQPDNPGRRPKLPGPSKEKPARVSRSGLKSVVWPAQLLRPLGPGEPMQKAPAAAALLTY
jgi:hypothetical protein